MRTGARRARGTATGYLKRLREICDKYNLLLIFDEVITGFGRLGTPFALRDMVELAYLDGEDDGPRSYAATAWVAKGKVSS